MSYEVPCWKFLRDCLDEQDSDGKIEIRVLNQIVDRVRKISDGMITIDFSRPALSSLINVFHNDLSWKDGFLHFTKKFLKESKKETFDLLPGKLEEKYLNVVQTTPNRVKLLENLKEDQARELKEVDDMLDDPDMGETLCEVVNTIEKIRRCKWFDAGVTLWGLLPVSRIHEYSNIADDSNENHSARALTALLNDIYVRMDESSDFMEFIRLYRTTIRLKHGGVDLTTCHYNTDWSDEPFSKQVVKDQRREFVSERLKCEYVLLNARGFVKLLKLIADESNYKPVMKMENGTVLRDKHGKPVYDQNVRIFDYEKLYPAFKWEILFDELELPGLGNKRRNDWDLLY